MQAQVAEEPSEDAKIDEEMINTTGEFSLDDIK